MSSEEIKEIFLAEFPDDEKPMRITQTKVTQMMNKDLSLKDYNKRGDNNKRGLLISYNKLKSILERNNIISKIQEKSVRLSEVSDLSKYTHEKVSNDEIISDTLSDTSSEPTKCQKSSSFI